MVDAGSLGDVARGCTFIAAFREGTDGRIQQLLLCDDAALLLFSSSFFRAALLLIAQDSPPAHPMTAP